ncbi:HAD hydrolase-like protein [Marinomonas fungiae]|uniref:HAD hydrolase-like protein n=1 Tax=Marinomonas fungiae TaxID=1137284 RepID=UPI003A904F3D
MTHHEYYLLKALTGWKPTIIKRTQLSSPPDGSIDFASLLSKIPEDITHISFDVFDTILRRNVHPPELTKQPAIIWLHTLIESKSTAPRLSIAQLFAMREQAEAQARQNSLELGKDSECTLQELFQILLDKLNWEYSLELEEHTLSTMLEIELDTERNQLSVMPLALECLQALRNKGIKISFISDMYLHYEHIELLLKVNQLLQSGDQLFVSSKERLTKGSGRLYKKLIDDEIISPENHCHIGDNPISDVKRAREQGLYALRFYSSEEESRKALSKQHRKLIHQTGDLETLFSNAVRPRSSGSSDLYELAYSKLAPVFGLFVQHILKQTQKVHYDRVFFLARDGYLPLKLFKQLANSLPNDLQSKLPKTSYLYLSRASTRFVSFTGDKGELLSLSQRVNKQDGVWAILKTLGLDCEDYQTLVKSLLGENYSPHTDIDKSSDEIHKLLANHAFNEKVAKDLIHNRSQLLDYLKQEGWLGSKKILVIDIGWNGSIFASLESAFSDHPHWPQIDVLLFGHLPNSDIRLTNILPGFAMDMRTPHPIESLFNECRELFEVSASSMEGSVLGYQKQSDRITPKLATRQIAPEEEEAIAHLQQGIMDGSYHLNRLITDYLLDTNSLRASAIIEATSLLTGLNPHYVKALSNLKFDLSWGTDSRVSMAEYLGYTASQGHTVPEFNHSHLQLTFDDGADTNVADPQKVLEKLHQIVEMLKAEEKVILYGVGTVTSLIAPLIDSKLKYFVDGNTALHGKLFLGKPVISPDKALQDCATLFVTPIGRKNVISKRLINRIEKTLYIDDYL